MPLMSTQDLRDGSDPSVDPSAAQSHHKCLSVSAAVRKPFLKKGNGLRDTKGTNPNVKFLDQIFISQERGTLLYLVFKMYFSQKMESRCNDWMKGVNKNGKTFKLNIYWSILTLQHPSDAELWLAADKNHHVPKQLCRVVSWWWLRRMLSLTY